MTGYSGETVPDQPGSRGHRSETLRDFLREVQDTLSKSGIQNAGQEAGWLLQAGMGLSGLTLCVEGGRAVRTDERERSMALVRRRASFEPLQYILGTQEFYSLEFMVTPAVLIPRVETEMLVREAVNFAKSRPSPLLADIGTGSGCIAVALSKHIAGATIYATDLSVDALAVARANAVQHGACDHVRFLEGDLFGPLYSIGLQRQLSVVLSNPPYMADRQVERLQPEVSRHEPRIALAGGADGLTFHRRLLREAPVFLQPGGLLLMEVGEHQAKAVADLAAQCGVYADVQILKDQAGLSRVVRLVCGAIAD